MKKIINLVQDIKDENGEVIATMTTALRGNGETPVIQTLGSSNRSIIGYKDDGSVILAQSDEEVIANAQKRFMAEAIKEQKKLCVENGVDPSLVNILNAEKRADK